MQAIILAAGMGKRLGEKTRDNTKCMLEVNGIRLIDRALENLCSIGIGKIIIVVGYKGENVKDYVGNVYHGIPVEYVDNDIYYRTNNIYSLFLAKEYLQQDDTILLESDLIYNVDILQKLICDTFPNIALVDKYESWMDGTVVTLDDENKITRFIDKNGFRYDEIKSYYKTVNIYKFSQEFSSRYYVPFLNAYCTALGQNEYYEQVLKIILDLHTTPIKALPLEGETWYEIDDIQDLDIAEGMFAPSDEERYLAVSSRYGGYWRYPQMKDFCYLVNPFFPPQRMLDEMKASFETLMREYPSGMYVNTLLAAKNFGVKKEFIVVGNGAAELIKVLIEGHSNILGNICPTFEEYPNREKGQSVQFIPDNRDFRYSASDIKSFFEKKEIDTLLLINPDNPSGNYIPYEELIELIEWTCNKQIEFVVDESFVDFADVEGEKSLLHNAILERYPHLVVVKSISKSYGVPGLRLGVLASGDTSLISSLKKEVSIWNINSYGEFFMQILEKYNQDYVVACEKFREERSLFFRELQQIPYVRVIPSQANYFLCEVTGGFSSAKLCMELLNRNIFIKDCSTKKGFGGKNYIRLAVRDREDNEYLINVLRSL